MTELKKSKRNKNSDYLAEAYTTLSEIARKAFNDSEINNDTYEFLKSISTQINLYRYAIVIAKKRY